MSRITKPIALLGLFFLIFSLSNAAPFAKETVIYVVRHAEKDTSDPKNNDPELNAEGKQRALDLNEFLKREKLTAVFSTNYKRTMQTVASLAQRNGIPVKTYDPKNPGAVAKLVKEEFLNKKIAIAGHSNTILGLIKAFGSIPPVDKLEDDDYDLLFTITINKDGESSLTTQRFGNSHHSTEIPLMESVH